jgi:hypothetical protein
MPITLSMVLAQSVVEQNGLLTVLGGGWMVRAPGAVAGGPSALAFVLQVPRDQLDVQQQLRVELLDEDDEIIFVDPPAGPGPMIFESEFSARGVDDPRITIPVTVGLAINLPPFPLPRGREYRWRAFVNGETQDSWTLPFRTSPPQPPRRR